MKRLLEDVFTRRVCQVVLTLAFLGLALWPAAIFVVLLMYWKPAFGALGMQTAATMLTALQSPWSDTGGQALLAVTAILPTLVTGVRFGVTTNAAGLVVNSDRLNLVGMAGAIILLAGVAFALAAITILNVMPGLAAELLTADADNAAVSKTLAAGVSAILAIHVIHITRLLGIDGIKV